MKTIGIIGYGDFAQLMVRYLSPHTPIVVATRQKHSQPVVKNISFVSNAEALAQDIVIPSLPSQFLEAYFTDYGHCLKPGSLVIDVCSVKVKPVEVLQRLLPQTVDFLATHPMFGPASASNSLKGQRIMMAPIRMKHHNYDKIKQFVSDTLSLKIIECSPQEHDRAMAYVQGLSHYIGRVMDGMHIPDTELLTNAYADLLDMKRIQGGDSWELFESIMFENPYALDVHQQFEEACHRLDAKLGL